MNFIRVQNNNKGMLINTNQIQYVEEGNSGVIIALVGRALFLDDLTVEEFHQKIKDVENNVLPKTEYKGTSNTYKTSPNLNTSPGLY